jgi:hypothetical protein
MSWRHPVLWNSVMEVEKQHLLRKKEKEEAIGEAKKIIELK